MDIATSALSPAIRTLLADASDNGYAVTATSLYSILVTKTDRRNGTYKAGVTIALTETGAFGAAVRVDVACELATTIRTIKATREILGLAATKPVAA